MTMMQIALKPRFRRIFKAFGILVLVGICLLPFLPRLIEGWFKIPKDCKTHAFEGSDVTIQTWYIITDPLDTTIREFHFEIRRGGNVIARELLFYSFDFDSDVLVIPLHDDSPGEKDFYGIYLVTHTTRHGHSDRARLLLYDAASEQWGTIDEEDKITLKDDLRPLELQWRHKFFTFAQNFSLKMISP